MSRASVRPDVSERVLGHAIPGVEGVYDRYPYDREKAEALAQLVSLVRSIIDGTAESGAVIRCPRDESASRPGSRPSAPPRPRSIRLHAR